MSVLIPNRFLFAFEFPMRHRRKPPPLDGKLTGWTERELLPKLGELDGEPEFGDVWACWNDAGLWVACRVGQKSKTLRCDPREYWKSDHLRLCVGMRETRNIKRATRFCQQFYFMPAGGGAKGAKPIAGGVPIKRAREDAPMVPSDRIPIASRVTKSGYTLEAHLPADSLAGFDPNEHTRIGFYYILEDRDHGQQFLTVGDDLYWFVDPSTWATAVLDRKP